MVTKSFGIFSGDNEHIFENGDNFIIEVGKSHIALVLTRADNASVAGFELFTFTEHEALPDKLFAAISNTSNLLNHSFSGVKVFVNHEFCLPVPAAKFSDNASEDFLTLIFGEAENISIYNEHTSLQSHIVNVYRVSRQLEEVLRNRFDLFEIHHSWSNMLNMLDNKGLLSAAQLIYVQFYNTYFIAVVVKDGFLQLIQTFVYENSEDVLYQLLNVTVQFGLSTTETEVVVSGLIDPNYKLFRELTNYFKNIVADKVSLNHVLLDVNEYPRHYFTPFFNLAL